MSLPLISFLEMYEMLEKKGPGKAISRKGTSYKIEARNNNIIAFPKSGRVTIHNDCWGKSLTCNGARAGGIYNGSYSIFDWYNEMNNNEVQKPSKNKSKSKLNISTKKLLSESSDVTAKQVKNNPEIYLSGNPHKIVHRAMEKITEINQNRKNHKKDPIFKKDVYVLSRIIENRCTSRELFINFSLNLYIMIYETTRKKSNNANNDKRKPYYDFLLPYEFFRRGTDTRYFMDMVGTLRHHYAHLEPEYKEQIDKIPYEDVLKELVMDKEEPTSKEEFLKLQIAVLEKFEASMKRLLEIVKNELNPDKTH